MPELTKQPFPDGPKWRTDFLIALYTPVRSVVGKRRVRMVLSMGTGGRVPELRPPSRYQVRLSDRVLQVQYPVTLRRASRRNGGGESLSKSSRCDVLAGCFSGVSHVRAVEHERPEELPFALVAITAQCSHLVLVQ